MMSEHRFIVAADTSGSMAEGGRIILLRHLCRYILQRRAFGGALAEYEIRIVSWGREVRAVEPAEDGGVPLPEPCGRCSGASLTAWLQGEAGGPAAESRLLILTDDDGGEAGDVAEAARMRGIPAACVYVGAECDAREHLHGSRWEFHAEHIGAAVQALLEAGAGRAEGLPATVAELGECIIGDSHGDDW